MSNCRLRDAKACVRCFAEFNPWPPGTQKFCSRACRDAAATSLHATKCLVCDAEIKRRSPPGKYCSKVCHGVSMKGGVTRPVKSERVPCVVCGSFLVVRPYRKASNKFCSRGCYLVVHTANNTTPELERLRCSAAYRKWRTAVFERDGYVCVLCGDRNRQGRGVTVELHADHIKPFAHFPELQFVVDNGRTLCVPCHRATDTYGGRARRKVETA